MEARRRDQQTGFVYLQRVDAGGGLMEGPSQFYVGDFWDNFCVANEKTLEGLTAGSVERDFQDTLLWTPRGAGDAVGSELFGSKLRAIETPRDGNCLLHALSIGASGATDHSEVLRSELRSVFQNVSLERKLRRAYVEGQVRQDMGLFQGNKIEVDHTQMDREYQDVKRAGTKSKAELYAFHIFLLANILRRPIVVYGEKAPSGVGDSGMPGVYLPTLRPEEVCTKNPLAIVYNLSPKGSGHFTGLIGTGRGLRRLPLFYSDGEDLPIRFGVPATSPRWLADNGLLFKYMAVSVHGDRNAPGKPLALMAEVSATPSARPPPPPLPTKPWAADAVHRQEPSPVRGQEAQFTPPLLPRRPWAGNAVLTRQLSLAPEQEQDTRLVRPRVTRRRSWAAGTVHKLEPSVPHEPEAELTPPPLPPKPWAAANAVDMREPSPTPKQGGSPPRTPRTFIGLPTGKKGRTRDLQRSPFGRILKFWTLPGRKSAQGKL